LKLDFSHICKVCYNEDYEKNNINIFENIQKYSNIKNIVIKNKKNKYGHIRFNDELHWYPINNEETLFGWLEHNLDDCFKEIVNYDLLINDIVNKCYIKYPKYYNFKYEEYLIKNTILNTKNFELIKNTDKIILTKYNTGSVLHDLNFDNIEIIQNIMEQLLNNNDKLRKYKQFCYNVIVEPSCNMIFYDNSNDIHKHLLYKWIIGILDTINSGCHPNGHIFYYDIVNRKELPNNTKLVVIDMFNYGYSKPNINKENLDEQIEYIQSKGIKNILIKTQNDNNDYNYKNYLNYILNNKNEIFSLFHKEHRVSLNNYNEHFKKEINYEDIFLKTDLLFNNFLKWCCTK
jgi:hypothetical protein